MNNKKEYHIKIGGSFFTTLTLIFIAAKIFGESGILPNSIASWSWWWIFSPLWLPMAIIIGFFVVCFIIFLLSAICTAIVESRKRPIIKFSNIKFKK